MPNNRASPETYVFVNHICAWKGIYLIIWQFSQKHDYGRNCQVQSGVGNRCSGRKLPSAEDTTVLRFDWEPVGGLTLPHRHPGHGWCQELVRPLLLQGRNGVRTPTSPYICTTQGGRGMAAALPLPGLPLALSQCWVASGQHLLPEQLGSERGWGRRAGPALGVRVSRKPSHSRPRDSSAITAVTSNSTVLRTSQGQDTPRERPQRPLTAVSPFQDASWPLGAKAGKQMPMSPVS